MSAASRPSFLLLALVLTLVPAVVDARRHGHGHGHHGWMHARIVALRGWFHHAGEPGRDRHRAPTHRSPATTVHARAAEEAALAARRRSEVDDYLRAHPVFAAAE
jgi:hypothetical protein